MKKLLSCLLILMLMLQLVPLAALPAHAEEPEVVTGAWINPLCADVLSEEDLIPEAPTAAIATRQTYSDAEAVTFIRQQLVSRATSFSFTYAGGSFSKEKFYELWGKAISHTGVGTEGDYLRYQIGGNGFSSYGGAVNVSVSYYASSAQETQVTTKIAQVLSSLSLGGKTDVQKIRAIHDYIVAHVSYDNANLNNTSYLLKYTAYAALMNGTAVCQGYCNLFYRMLLQAGIDARIVSGTGITGTGSGPHAWTIVKIGSLYYDVDVTWDENTDSYKWYLLGEPQFSKDHVRGKSPESSGGSDIPNVTFSYSSAEFNAQYPMSQTNYTEGSTPTPDPDPSPFEDVKKGNWFYDAVMWAYDNGITGGIDATHFGPNRNCTRAQVVTFLYTFANKPVYSVESNPFEDVSSTAWYYNAVMWAFSNGITGGIDATHFGPGKTCTRAQVMTFIYSFKGRPYFVANENPFEDVSENAYYYQPVLWAFTNGVTGGIDATHFGPGRNCTRCQVVTFLYKIK